MHTRGDGGPRRRRPRGRRLSAALGAAVGMALVATFATAAQAAPASGRGPATRAASVTAPAALVDPFIGTSDQAGADMPFGMVQWSPDTPSYPPGGGYEYNDSSITGFSLTHIAGPGCGAAGDVPVLPTVGAVNNSVTDGFSHANESASAGSCKVALNNRVTTELTATARSGMARFTFPSSTQSNLVFKLASSQSGTVVQLWGCNGTGAQKWTAGAGGSLVTPQSGKCLDDPGSSTANGARLQICTCNAGGAQTWRLPV